MSPQQRIEAEFAPLINAAAQRDAERSRAAAERRDAALLTAPYLVCGVPLRPMTVIDYVTLVVAGNAHVTAVEVPQDPVSELRFWGTHNFALLWLLSPNYEPSAAARDSFVARHANRIPFGDLLRGIEDYLRDTFADAPARPATTSGAPDPIGCSFVVYWQHRICSAYHWSRTEFRALPLKELFQILRLLDAETTLKNGKELRAPLGGEADRLWAEMLDQINALRTAAR